MEIYGRLAAEYGPQHWWPADDPFEVMVGAILTQSTAWTNVEKAIANLKRADALSADALYRLPLSELAILIRPSGYYNAKARKLKAFVTEFVENYEANLERLFAPDAETLRERLLAIYGVGEETADSIILYAAKKPIFVVDAYTKRVVARLGFTPVGYADIQAIFMDNLPLDERLFNEFHALFVSHGKDRCRKRPLCPCCLSALCRSCAEA
ncbi:MAG: endonuclease III domain-containing protein [Chloroflexi bacterium]|nr:endonuclease III domain-containing protein [Chloroflexota bacterium]